MGKDTAKYQHILFTAQRLESKARANGFDTVLIISKATPTGAVFSVIDSAAKAVVRRYDAVISDEGLKDLTLTFTAST